MLLRIDGVILVRLAIEVDSEARDHRNRSLEVDERIRNRTARSFVADPPGHREVSIKPRVHQNTAIRLDAQLTEARRGVLGIGFDPQTGAVGVGAHHPDAVLHDVLLAVYKGDDRRIVTRHKISPRGFDVPPVAFV